MSWQSSLNRLRLTATALLRALLRPHAAPVAPYIAYVSIRQHTSTYAESVGAVKASCSTCCTLKAARIATLGMLPPIYINNIQYRRLIH